jgi:hypothetical protein
MNRYSAFVKAMPLLLGAGLMLSACSAAPDYGANSYSYVYNGDADYPYDGTYDWLDFRYDDFDHFHHGLRFRPGHQGPDFGHHAEYGLAPSGWHGFGGNTGHGFAAHGGFGGHGGHGRG